MTDDATRRPGDHDPLEEAADQGPVTEGLDTSDPAAGDPDRIRELPREDLDAEARRGAETSAGGGEAAGLAGGAGLSVATSNPETRRVAGGDEVDDSDAIAMPTDPGGGTH